MNPQDLLTILIIIFFVVGPIINSLLRRAGGQSPPARPQPSQPPQPDAQTASAAPRDEAREGPMSDFERRLEEARRRVQEAMAQESQGQPTRQTRPTPQTARSDGPRAPVAAPRQAPRPQSPRQEPSARAPQRPPAAPRQTPAGTQRGGSQGAHNSNDTQNTRAQALRPYDKRSAPGAWTLKLDPTSLRQAVIWRELLDQPLSKRRRQHP